MINASDNMRQTGTPAQGREARRREPLSRRARFRGILTAAAILFLCAAATVLGRGGALMAAGARQSASTSCANTAAIPDPEPAGLIADCETLLGLMDELTGDASPLNWSVTRPISDWEGVTVKNGRVTRLTLTRRLRGHWGARGSIPGELGQLTNLEYLSLFDNKLIGSIPGELGQLTNLAYLNLSLNELTGSIPSELGNLTNLQELEIRHTSLTGSIPAELGNLTNLTQLWLNNNNLTGSIPAELGNLTNLQMLTLTENDLTGSIPAGLANLTNLTALWLNHNGLTGSVPAELGQMTNLEYLKLQHNNLTGSIPAELGNLISLENLDLNNNNLTGSIPAELGKLSNLAEGLWLNSNRLTGSIPVELGQISELRVLHLANNGLTGSIPAELGNLSKLIFLHLDNNALTGRIPATLDNLVPPASSMYSNRLLIVQIATGNALCGPIPPKLHNFYRSINNDLHIDHYPSGSLGACSSSSEPTPTPTATNGAVGEVDDLPEPTETPTLTATPTATKGAVGRVDDPQEPTATPTPTATLTPTATPELSTPALTAEGSEGAVELRWEAVPGAARYEILISWAGAAEWQQIGGDNLTGTSFTHIDVTGGRTYYYTIRSVNAAGEKSVWLWPYPSATVSAPHAQEPTLTPTATQTPTPAPTLTPTATGTPTATSTPTQEPEPQLELEIPGPVDDLLLSATTDSVNVSWQPPASGGAPNRYVVHLTPDGGGKGETKRPKANKLSVTFRNLESDKTYKVWVRAQNKAGKGERVHASITLPSPQLEERQLEERQPKAAQEAHAQELQPTPTPTPTETATPTPMPQAQELTAPALTAQAAAGAVQLRWEAVAGAVRYELLVWWDGLADWQPLGGDNLTGTSYTHTDLAAGTTYYYTIIAVNADGEASDWLQDPYPSATVTD